MRKLNSWDGNIEVLTELETELDDQIEHYLSTGEIEETNIQYTALGRHNVLSRK